jgi:hypothetical protein
MSAGGDYGALRERILKLEYDLRYAPSMDTLRTVQESMRSYVEERDKAQSAELEKQMEYRIAGARSDIERDQVSLLRDNLDRWVEEKLEPIVTRILEERDKVAEERRKAQRDKYRSWIILATSALLFLGTMFQLIGGNKAPDEINKYNRAVERFNDVVKP